jgi:predicted transposase YbfD/YdcC
VCLGQEHTRGTGNEIPAIKAPLETLALKGCIVTLDAIGCRTAIAQKILERGGDYLLAVKDNQDTPANALREFFADGEAGGSGSLPAGRHRTIGKGHGRIETRQALWVTDLSWLDKRLRERWPQLAGIGMIERQREINGAVSVERAFRIGSKGSRPLKPSLTPPQVTRASRIARIGCSTSPFARTTALSEETMHPIASPPCASLRWPCRTRIPSIPGVACAPEAKPPNASPTTMPHCSDSPQGGRCGCAPP